MMLRHPLHLAVMVATALACTACGIKGPLYLPRAATPAAAPVVAPPAVAPETKPGPSSPPAPPAVVPPVEPKY